MYNSSVLVFVLSLLVLVNLGVGLASITVGTRGLSGCPVETLLPVAVIVNGGMCALLALSCIWEAIRANGRSTGAESERLMPGGGSSEGLCFRCMEAARWLLNTSAVAWAALTLFLALRTRSLLYTIEMASTLAPTPTPTPTPTSGPGLCDPVLVFKSVILASIAIGSVTFVSLVGIACYVTRK